MNSHTIRFLIFAVVGLFASFAPAVAAAPAAEDATTNESPAPVDTRGLTGDWGGLRSSLEQRGLTAFAFYTTGLWSNLVGGRETGVRYLGFAQWGLEADLEALAGWRGAALHVDWQSYHGGQPSEYLVGASPLQNTSGLEAEQSIRFYQLYLEQAALDDRLYAKVGQLALDQDFMVAEHALSLRNAAFGDFVTSGSNGTFAVYPVAAPGLYLEAEPWSKWRIRLGAYTSDPGDDERDNYGFDWSFSSRAGATIFGEIETEQEPFGLKGSYAFGVGIETGNVEDFEDGGRSEGLQILYASIDQTLYSSKTSGGGSDLEVGAFLRGAVPVQTDRVTFAWQMNGGIELTGAVPGRPTDAIAMGFAYLDFGRDYLRSVREDGTRVTSRELALELTYRAELTPWLWVQPDLQYFLDPHLGRRDAFVLGFLAGIEL